MVDTKDLYLILYRFLKEERIYTNYIDNLLYLHEYKYSSRKTVLRECVTNFLFLHAHRNERLSFENISGVFGSCRTSFVWNHTIEGYDFWKKYDIKWIKYLRNKMINKNLN